MEVIALLLPAVIDLINRRVASSDVRFWVSVAVCGAVGGGLNYIDTSFVFGSSKLALESISTSVMYVFGLAQLSYGAVYQDSKIQKMIRG